MKGLNCILANAQTKKLAAKYNLPESIVKTIQQTVASERKPDGLTLEEFVEQRLEEYNTRLQNRDVTTTPVPHYTGNITPEENTIFVFGSNPGGIHGAGSARVAVNQFGAKYGQGEGLQGNAYALPTKRIENITPKLKGDMSYSFNGRQRATVTSSTTIEAIINGERTATTRYESDGNIDYWQQAQVGDIIEFHSKDRRTKVYVRVTKPLTKLDPNINSEEWSKKEGWSSQYFNYAVKPKIDQAYQIEFEYVGAYGERTVTSKEIIENIKKLYAVAASNPNKKFKIAYRNKRGDVTLNGYSGQEMMNMFLSVGTIPSNIVFSEEWTTDPYFTTLYREVNKPENYDFNWGRVSDNNYEVSSAGDMRFIELPIEKANTEARKEAIKQLPMSKKQQMFKAIDPNTRIYRYKRIATDFIETLYDKIEETIEDLKGRLTESLDLEQKQTLMMQLEALKGSSPIAAYLKNYSADSLFNEVKNDYSYYVDEASDKELLTVFPTKNPRGAEYVREQIKLMLDNFDALVEESLGYIEEMSGVSVTLNPQITITGDATLDIAVVEEEGQDIENTDVDENTHVDIGGGNSFKVRMRDNFKTLTTKVKKVLSSIVRHDANGNIEEDDLGTPLYINARNVHGILIDELSSMIDSKDFCVKTENNDGSISYSFPTLEKMAKKYSWVNQIIETLQNNPRLIGAFYGAYRKDFIKRFVYKSKQGIIPVNETSVFNSAWKELNAKLEEGQVISKKSIYGPGVVYKDKVEGYINTAKEVIDNVIDIDVDNKNNITKVTNKIVETLAQIGIKVNASPVKEMLLDKESREEIIKALKYTLEIAQSVKDSKEEAASLMTKSTRPKYIKLLRALDIANDTHTEQMYKQGGKSKSSYTVPGYLETLFKKLKQLKGKALEEFINTEFKNIRGPFYSPETGWMNSILKDLADPKYRATTQSALETSELDSIDGIEYKNWTPTLISRAFVSMFLDEDFAGENNTTTKADYVWYNAPIFSDSPVVKFIKLKRYKRTATKTLDEVMMPLFVKIVKQELMRIKHIEEREKAIAEGKTKEIANYDSRGKKLFYFSELNKALPLMQDALKNKPQSLNKIIEDALRPVLQEEFENWLLTSQLLKDKALEVTIMNKYHESSEEKKREILWDYYLNQTYATSQIIQLLVTDPAFYSSSVDFQKRFKEVYAAGTKLNTQTEFGKETQKAIILKDRSGVSSKLETIKKVLNAAVSDGRILSMDRDNILNKLKNFCATDGQAFRSLPSLKSIYDMMGVLEDVEEVLDRIVKGQWDMKDFYTIFQTLKPFIYTSLKESDGVGGTMRVGHQEKDSEYISLLYETIAMGLNPDTEMQAIQDFMEEKDIDIVVFESGVKTGGQGPIDIYDTQKVRDAIANSSFVVDGIEISLGEDTKSLEDIQSLIHDRVVDGDITQEQANKLLDYFKPTYEEVKGILNNAIYTKDENGRTIETPGVIKSIPTEDYCITMSTSSEHLVDSETIYGTQFNTLIVADLTDDTVIKLGKKEYKGNQIKEFYHSLKIENLLDDFEAVKDIFKSPKQLVKEILKRIDSNAKYNKGIKDAIKLVQKKDPVTGSMRTSFAIPLNNPTMKDQLQEIVLSIFKNRITKQKIKGGTAYLVSDIGFTDELQIAYKTNANGDTYIDYIPCYLPCTAKEMFKDILVERSTMKGITYYELDINAKDENDEYVIDRDLLDLVGYRIPTEHKYSMAPLRVVGFLPQQNGSSIMLPAEDVIVFSGADYDIDKLFLMMYEYYKDEYNKAQGKRDYDKLGSSEISFEEWWEQNKKNYARKQPLYRKLKYDYTKTPEQNSRKQRNNALIDISRSVLRNPTSAKQILRPQGFDSFIRGSALTQIIEDSNIVTAIMRDMSIKSFKELSEYLLSLSNDDLNQILKNYKQEVPLLSPRNFLYYHSQNMAGGNSLGAYANNTTRQAKYQGTGLTMSKAFKFNGRVVAALDQVYTTRIDPVTGEKTYVLITQNCCEGVGASADNAKNPTISTMRQHSGLIRLSGLLLSAGLSMDDIALFFAHPIVANYIDNNGTLDGMEDSLGKEYKMATKGLDISTISLTSSQLLELNLLGNNANTSEEYETFISQSYPVIKLVATLWRASNALSPITKVSRVDSTNGAIAHNFGGAGTQRFLVDEVHRQSSKEGYPLNNVGAVPENFGKNILSMDKAELRNLFATKGNPFIQACHTLGIEAPQHILAEYFSEMSEGMQQHLDDINHDAPGVTIKPELAQSFLSHYVIYRLGTYDLFRTKGDFLTTRDYYLNEFPNEFRRIVSTNEDIGKIEVLQRLHLSGKGVRKTLRLEDANLMTEIEAERLRTSFDELLYLDNPNAQQLAIDLFVYTYFADSLAFLPHSLTRFFSPEFLSSIPGYIEKLQEIEEEAREGIKMKEYTEYWYNNTMRQANLRSYTLGQEVNSVETEEGKVYVSSRTKNIGNDWRYRIKLKTISSLGNTYALLQLIGISGDGETAYYVEVPHYTSISFYNPDMSVEDSIKEVKKRGDELKEAQEKELEREAWIAGVENTSNELDNIDDVLSSRGIDNFESMNFDTLDSFMSSIEGGDVMGDTTIEASMSELEAFYPQDSTENDRLC